MEKKLKAALVFVIALCLVLSIGAAQARADSDGAAVVTASALNMRGDASTSSQIVTCLPRGTTVVVTGTSGDWYQVAYKGYTGYMNGEYLSLTDTADGSFGTGVVTGNIVRIRSGPDTSQTILGTCDKGAEFSVTGVSGSWYKISYNGSTGYISSAYLRLGGTGAADAAASSPSSSSSSSSSSVSGQGTISGNYVRMRSGPSTSHSILGTYNKGTVMTVTGESGDWYEVTCSGTSGYVYKAYLKLGDSGSAGGADSYSVTSMDSTTAAAISAVHMRKGPATSYTSLRVLSPGTTVTLTGYTDEWYRVSYNGEEGYVYKTYLTTDTASVSTSSSAGERIVAEAKKYLGVPYVYGGTSPSGFDCSGFVYYIYRQCGYSITRTAVTQNGDGVMVSRSELQPGDIVIFYNSAMSGIGHSGMYIGNGQFIHASSGAGKVCISDLSSNYYNTHYYSARRVVN